TFDCLGTVTNPGGHVTGETIPPIDQPQIATGPGPGGVGQSVWVAFKAFANGSLPINVFFQFLPYETPNHGVDLSLMAASGARTTGLGQVSAFIPVAGQLDPFSEPGITPSAAGRTFASVTVSATGQPVVSFISPSDDAGA